MTPEEIEDYKGAIGESIQLFGFTSTTVNKDLAETFMCGDKETGKEKVLFHIDWHEKMAHYYLNAGAFENEDEVVLMDGI